MKAKKNTIFPKFDGAKIEVKYKIFNNFFSTIGPKLTKNRTPPTNKRRIKIKETN